jgi:hypothetical protein
MAKIRDTCDMYDMFVSVLILAFKMTPKWKGGAWPREPRVGSTRDEYKLADFPDIKIQASVGVYLDVTHFVLRMPAESSFDLPCVEFCGQDGSVLRRVEASTVADMFDFLRPAIAWVRSSGARPSAVEPADSARQVANVVEPAVDLARRVANVVDAFDTEPGGAEGVKSREELFELIHAFLDLMMRKSDARRSAGGGG